MKRAKARIFASILTLAMVLQTMPVVAFAETDSPQGGDISAEEVLAEDTTSSEDIVLDDFVLGDVVLEEEVILDEIPEETPEDGNSAEEEDLEEEETAEVTATVLSGEAVAMSTYTTWAEQADTSWYVNNTTEAYTLSTEEELAGLAVMVNEGVAGLNNDAVDDFANCTITLGANLDLADYKWTPIGNSSKSFSGTFDGNGKTISNMTITDDTAGYVGLFGTIGHPGVVQDLTLEDVNVSSTGESVGGLVGEFCGTKISKCTVSGSVSGNTMVGGLIGYMMVDEGGVSVEDCTNSAKVVGTTNHMGGIIGAADLYYFENDVTNIINIENCHNTGAISGNMYVGGIIGYNLIVVDGSVAPNATAQMTIEDCSNTGTITGNSSYVGGIVGDNRAGGQGDDGDYYLATVIIDNCFNTGTIFSGGYYAGGIAGRNLGTDGTGTGSIWVTNCYNTGSVTGDMDVGGIVGRNLENYIHVYNCYNTGAIEATTNGYAAGGIVGTNNHDTSSSDVVRVGNCYSTGSVTATLAGGVIGGYGGASTVKDCYWLASACTNGYGDAKATSTCDVSSFDANGMVDTTSLKSELNGWSDSSSDNDDITYNTWYGAGTTVTFDSSLKSYTVTYNHNDGTNDTTEIEHLGETTILSLDRSGYVLEKWTTASDGTGTSYTVGEVEEFTSNITLYAQWTLVPCTVTFALNGGNIDDSTTVADQAITVGNTVTDPGTPTRTGYTFTGWFADDATTAWVFATDTVTGDTNLTAIWTLDKPGLGILRTTQEGAYTEGVGASYTGDVVVTLTAEPSHDADVSYTYSWSDGTSVVGTSQILELTDVTNATYTVTVKATDGTLTSEGETASRAIIITKVDSVGDIGTTDGLTEDGDTIYYGDKVTIEYTPEIYVVAQVDSVTPMSVLFTDTTAPKTVELWYNETTLLDTVTDIGEGDTATLEFDVDKTTFDSSLFDGSTPRSFTIKWGGDDNLDASSQVLNLTLAKKPVTATATTITKEYDGTNTATVVLSVADSLISGDTVTITTNSATYVQTGVGIGLDVSINGSNSGADLGYYAVTIPDLTGSITTRTVSLSDTDISAVLSADTFIYDGTEKKPTITITDNGLDASVTDKVISASEYEVGYSDNTDVGTNATVTITDVADGNYSISGSKTFSITSEDSETETTAPDNTTDNVIAVEYGSSIKLVAEVSVATAKVASVMNVVENTDNYVDFYLKGETDTYLGSAPVLDGESAETAGAGTATFTYDTTEKLLSAGENTVYASYNGSVNLNESNSTSITVKVTQKALTATIATEGNTITKVYDGITAFSEVALDLVGIEGQDDVSATADGTSASVNVGAQVFTPRTVSYLSGNQKDYYTLDVDDVQTDGEVSITTRTVINANITITLQTANDTFNYVYTGDKKEPTITIKDNGLAISVVDTTISDDEYEVVYSDNTDAGTSATITITDVADGNYSISGSTTFEITNATMTDNTDQTQSAIYTGEELSPETGATATTVDESEVTVTYSKDGTDESYTLDTMPTFKENGEHTVYYQIVAANHTTITDEITFTIGQSDTTFDKDETSTLKSYNGDEEATEFTYGDTITVKVTPTATGEEPVAATTSYTEQSKNDLALYIESTQITAPITDIVTGTEYTFTIQTTEQQLVIGENEITAKYVGDDNMADYSDSITVELAKKALTATLDTSEGAITKEYDGNGYFDDQSLDYTIYLAFETEASDATTVGKLASDDEVIATVTGYTATVNASENLDFIADVVSDLSGDDADYYSVSANDVSGTVAITKAEAQVLEDIESSQRYTDQNEKEQSIVGLLLSDSGTETYKTSDPIFKDADGEVTTSDMEVAFDVDADGLVTYTLKGTSSDVGKTVTLPVVITSGNYADSTVNLVVTILKKASNDDAYIKVTTTGNGTIDPDGGADSMYEVDKGDDVTFEFDPDSGYEVTDVIVNGVSVGVCDEYEFENIMETVQTLEVVFEKKTSSSDEDDEEDDDSDVEDDETDDDADESEIPFADVDEDNDNYDGIAYVYENGIMAGMTSELFGGEYSITRGMIAAILFRVDGSEVVEADMPFGDITLDQYYAEAVRWGKSTGVMAGVSATEFAPNTAITNEQFIVFLFRYANYMGMDMTISAGADLSDYVDGAEISDYAYMAMLWAVDKGIIGDDDMLSPIEEATRGNVATGLMHFMKL